MNHLDSAINAIYHKALYKQTNKTCLHYIPLFEGLPQFLNSIQNLQLTKCALLRRGLKSSKSMVLMKTLPDMTIAEHVFFILEFMRGPIRFMMPSLVAVVAIQFAYVFPIRAKHTKDPNTKVRPSVRPPACPFNGCLIILHRIVRSRQKSQTRNRT